MEGSGSGRGQTGMSERRSSRVTEEETASTEEMDRDDAGRRN